MRTVFRGIECSVAALASPTDQSVKITIQAIDTAIRQKRNNCRPFATG